VGLGPFTLILGGKVVLIIEDYKITVKCRTVIIVLFIYFNLCQSVAKT